jgi:hypothetical protein
VWSFVTVELDPTHELLKGLKANVSIDWAHRDSARARLRVLGVQSRHLVDRI